MKRIIAFILCLAVLCAFSLFAIAYEGENYVQFSSTKVTFPTEQHISGDSNGDGTVNVLDVLATLKYISGDKTSSLRDSIDTNSDGKVGVSDALLIIRHVLGEDVGLGKLVG